MKLDRKQIRKRLREIARDPSSAAPEEAQRLTGEYRRLGAAGRRMRSGQDLSSPVVPVGLTEADAEAVRTWPPELRNRLHDGALTRVILPWKDS